MKDLRAFLLDWSTFKLVLFELLITLVDNSQEGTACNGNTEHQDPTFRYRSIKMASVQTKIIIDTARPHPKRLSSVECAASVPKVRKEKKEMMALLGFEPSSSRRSFIDIIC